MRTVQPSDLVGKTVHSVNAEAVNVLRLTFTDGTTLELWAEDAVNTSAGPIPGIFVDAIVRCGECGELAYKCYCDDDCPTCDKKAYACMAQSETGECPNKSV